mmetsp:Transcript_9980/g.21951  ORF Transcript_9980/g.21951 Transcript_9980/m.21951 type:complete len:526 (+) Transcript_9980:165-1742(+)
MSGEWDAGVPYLAIYVVFQLILQTWDTFLDTRQLQKNKEKEPPAEIKDLVPLERFQKSQVYQVDKGVFSMITGFIQLFWNFFEVIVLWPILWNMAKDLVGENEIIRSIMWQLLVSFVGYPLSIPIGLYSDFVIEARHGFNKKTMKLFWKDLAKSCCLSIVVTALLIPIVISVIRWGGDHFYLYIWVVCQVLIFVMMFIYPTFIMPLFNKFEPLHNEELRQRIEELAGSLNYPLQKLFQMDGSERSSHSNAFLFGFWKNKRIVLFDTLLQVQVNLSKKAGEPLGFDFEKTDKGLKLKLPSSLDKSSAAGRWNEKHSGRIDELKEEEVVVAFKKASVQEKDGDKLLEEVQRLKEDSAEGDVVLMLDREPYTTDEILAILCHEIGHWHHGHVAKMLVFSSIHIFVIFRMYAFVMNSAPLISSFGFSPADTGIMVSLNIFMLMLTPLETIVGFGMTLLTRMNEYQADEFAVRQQRGDELASGLRKLCVENLGDLNPDPWYAWFHHTHPALVERLQAIRANESVFCKKIK